MKLFYNVLILAAGLLLACCAKNPEFRLEAVSDDIGTQNVNIRYVDANGTFHIEQVPVVDGMFSYVGRTDGPSYVVITDNSGRKLGELIADGGDEIKAHFSISEPANISIEGNDDAILLKDWLDQNREILDKGEEAAVNAAIEAFVEKHPKQYASTVLVLQYFNVAGHEEQALSTLRAINEKYRPASKVLWFEQMLNISIEGKDAPIPNLRVFARKAGKSGADSAFTFSTRGAAYNLLLLTDNDSRSADSIRQLIEAVAPSGDGDASRKIRISDLGCDRDTLLWRSSMRSLPDDYPEGVNRYWLPAGPATPGLAEAAPPAIPSFILTDSLGHILLRTPSASSMRRFITHKKH